MATANEVTTACESGAKSLGDVTARYRTSLNSYPNPFNPSTRIAFRLEKAGPVRLRVYGLDGRVVADLVDAILPAGDHGMEWTARGTDSRILASGTYVIRLETADGQLNNRVTLLK